MSSFRHLLIAHRLLPDQFIRLDEELFRLLERLAAAQGRPVRIVAVEMLYAAAYADLARTRNDRRWLALTPREQQVAALACLGCTNGEIAAHLVISVNTVRSYMRSILDKYGVASKAELRLTLSAWDFEAWLEARRMKEEG